MPKSSNQFWGGRTSDVAERRALARFIHLDSRLLSRLRRPFGRFNAELLGVLRVQPLPAAVRHRLATNDAADGSSAEKAIQNVEADVPARGAEFTMPPTDVTASTIARLNDTCGNLIQLTQLARYSR